MQKKRFLFQVICVSKAWHSMTSNKDIFPSLIEPQVRHPDRMSQKTVTCRKKWERWVLVGILAAHCMTANSCMPSQFRDVLQVAESLV